MIKASVYRERFYFVLAALGLITAWWLNALAVFEQADYLKAWFGSTVDLVLSVDLSIVAIAVAGFMIYESRRLGMKRVWLYFLISGITALAFTLPLFMAFRERKLREIRLAGGKLERFEFDSHTVDIWVPASLHAKTPVLVMHDGRNIFDEKDSFTGKTWEVLTAIREEVRAIEVGNIFRLGTRYSEPLGLFFTDEQAQKHPVIMGCYGIGVSRLMGTVVEALADEKGIVWPATLAPSARCRLNAALPAWWIPGPDAAVSAPRSSSIRRRWWRCGPQRRSAAR